MTPRTTRRIFETSLRHLANRSRRVLGTGPLQPDSHFVYVFGFGSRHRAHCDCGWDGERRKNEKDALSDSVEHMVNNGAEGSDLPAT